MAYFVAKELHLRPMDILTGWSCEELLVAYGHYANAHSAERFMTMTPKERANHKDERGRPDPITWLDRWAVLFVTPEQLEKLNEDVENRTHKDGLSEAAAIFFS